MAKFKLCVISDLSQFRLAEPFDLFHYFGLVVYLYKFVIIEHISSRELQIADVLDNQSVHVLPSSFRC